LYSSWVEKGVTEPREERSEQPSIISQKKMETKKERSEHPSKIFRWCGCGCGSGDGDGDAVGNCASAELGT